MNKINIPFVKSFSNLPSEFYSNVLPENLAVSPYVIASSEEVIKLLGLSPLDLTNSEFIDYFSGSKIFKESDPLSQVYSGHQFGVWAGQLGDGRAILLGQVLGSNNKILDIQLKGAGKTPYSRFGDGRAVLRSCIREFLCSEHMNALGIPTTRALCVIASNEKVRREEYEPGAILTRVSESHIRFGHFEHFHYLGKFELVKVLADYCIENYHPEIKKGDYLSWFSEIVKRTATLIAKWQSIGFCHGVLNTDNMSIIGLTIDYGPFGFLEEFDPYHICNHSDYQGRYSYDQQPSVGLWNLNALLNSLSSLISVESGKEILSTYENIFISSYYEEMSKKLGLNYTELTNNSKRERIDSFISILLESRLDYTSTLRSLSSVHKINNDLLVKLGSTKSSSYWISSYIEDTKNISNFEQILNSENPKYILRNWVAESIIREVEDNKNLNYIKELQDILVTPFKEHNKFNKYSELPPDKYKNIQVSCSS